MNFQITRRFWKEATTLAEFLQRLKGRTVSLNLGSVQEADTLYQERKYPGRQGRYRLDSRHRKREEVA